MKQIILILFLAMAFAGAQAQKEIKRPDTYNYQRGLEAFGEGKSDEALDYFTKELEDHPDNGYAHYNISVIKYKNEEYGMALSEADKAMRYLPKKDKIWVSATYKLRAEIYLALEDTTKAITDLDTGLKRDPDNKSLLQDRGQLYYELEKYDKSDADFRKITEIDPGSHIGYIGLGRNLNNRKQFDAAVEMYTQAIKLNANWSQPYTYRAEAYWNLKKYREGADDMIRSLELTFNEESSGRTWHTFIYTPKEALPDLITKLKVKAEIDPANAYMWNYYTATAFEMKDDYRKAIGFYLKSYEKSENALTASRLADCYDEIGMYDEAIGYINKAIDLDSTRYHYLETKAFIEYHAGRHKEAIADMTTYLRQNPESNGYALRGQFKIDTGDIDGAIDDYTTSIAMEPLFFALTGRAALYLKKGENDKAMEDYRYLLQIDTVPEGHSEAHFALLHLGRKDEAKAWMDKVLDSDNSAGNYYDAACLYSLMDEKDKALSFLRTALEKGFVRFNRIGYDSDLDNVRSMPEFKSLIEKYEDKLKQGNQSLISGEDNDYTEETEEIPFTKEGNVYKIKCSINGLPLYFIFDTGASDISLSNVEASFMLKNGYIKSQDVAGRKNYLTASGEIVEGTNVNIREVSLGKLSLKDVQASVQNNQNAPLLLGQSVLNRLGKIEIDNSRHVLKVTYKKKVKK